MFPAMTAKAAVGKWYWNGDAVIAIPDHTRELDVNAALKALSIRSKDQWQPLSVGTSSENVWEWTHTLITMRSQQRSGQLCGYNQIMGFMGGFTLPLRAQQWSSQLAWLNLISTLVFQAGIKASQWFGKAHFSSTSKRIFYKRVFASASLRQILFGPK